MKVSILMPAYNAAAYIKEALDSIVDQTFCDFEVLLLDDGSTDDTSIIVTEYSKIDARIKYYKNEKNIGVIKTLNKGLLLAKGEYIVRMDSDDIMVRDRLFKQVNYMDLHPDCFVCGGQMKFIGGMQGKASTLPLDYEDLYYLALTNCPLYHPTTIIRNSIFKKYKFKYNDLYKHAEDYKLWSDITFLHKNSIANIKDIVLHYRISKSQITSMYNEEQKSASKKIRRENVQNVMDLYGIQLPETIDYKIINTVSSLVRRNNNPRVLNLILCMLYMSMKNSSERIKLFISSKDFSLYIRNFSSIKLGISILFSGIFKNRGKRYVI